jgi:hypothetical protein
MTTLHKFPTGAAGGEEFRAATPTDVAPYTEDLSGWVKTKGTPSMKTWVLHASPDGKMPSVFFTRRRVGSNARHLPRDLHRV